jgi:hypothetical protein
MFFREKIFQVGINLKEEDTHTGNDCQQDSDQQYPARPYNNFPGEIVQHPVQELP